MVFEFQSFTSSDISPPGIRAFVNSASAGSLLASEESTVRGTMRHVANELLLARVRKELSDVRRDRLGHAELGVEVRGEPFAHRQRLREQGKVRRKVEVVSSDDREHRG